MEDNLVGEIPEIMPHSVVTSCSGSETSSTSSEPLKVQITLEKAFQNLAKHRGKNSRKQTFYITNQTENMPSEMHEILDERKTNANGNVDSNVKVESIVYDQMSENANGWKQMKQEKFKKEENNDTFLNGKLENDVSGNKNVNIHRKVNYDAHYKSSSKVGYNPNDHIGGKVNAKSNCPFHNGLNSTRIESVEMRNNEANIDLGNKNSDSEHNHMAFTLRAAKKNTKNSSSEVDSEFKLLYAIYATFVFSFGCVLAGSMSLNALLVTGVVFIYLPYCLIWAEIIFNSPNIYSVYVPTEILPDWLRLSIPSSSQPIQINKEEIVSSISQLSGIRGGSMLIALRVVTTIFNMMIMVAIHQDLHYRGRQLLDIESNADMVPVLLLVQMLGLFYTGHFELQINDSVHFFCHYLGITGMFIGSFSIVYALDWSILSVFLLALELISCVCWMIYSLCVEKHSKDLKIVTRRSKMCIGLELSALSLMVFNGCLVLYSMGPNEGKLWVSPFVHDITPIVNAAVRLIAWSLFLVPFIICTFWGDKIGTFRQIFPNVSIAAHDVAFSRAKHFHKANKIIHVVTNFANAASLFSMLDSSPPLLSSPIPLITLNGAGIYFLCLSLHYFHIESSPLRASAVNFYLFICYCLRIPLQSFLGREKLLRHLLVYICCQLSQVFPGHLVFEGGYNHNDYHYFILQQYLAGISPLIEYGFFKDFNDEVEQYGILFYKDNPKKQPITKEGVDPPLLAVMKCLHWINLHVLPHYSSFDIDCLSFCPILQDFVALIGLLQLVVHRFILNHMNLLKAPQPLSNASAINQKNHGCPPKFRSPDGYGTCPMHPTTGVTGYAVGRNMSIIPKHLRNTGGTPKVQMVAQRLLAREGFVPAGDQLNIIAAAWIQMQVHGWMGHYDGEEVELNDGVGMCPMKKFKFFKTLERPDGHFDSERSQWWDASFLYGQNSQQMNETRSFQGGKLKVNMNNPDLLATRADGTYFIGDNKNSWAGISFLQILFLKEHNWICDRLSEEYPNMTDDEIYGYARNIIAAVNAKIHTVDWTVELLKTNQLRIGMCSNWYGLPKTLFGKKTPSDLFRLVKKESARDYGTPFCLTEEFTSVYRLHPLCPPGIVLSEGNFIPLEDLLGQDGRNTLEKSEEDVCDMMESMYLYPCGHLVGSNYPNALRKVKPSDERGNDLGFSIDLAAIDLYRDRERGVPLYQAFRRSLHLKQWDTWEEMTGDKKNAKKLELIYGPAPDGIERCDLLVGDLYEKKLKGFALSETSFVVFLLMASRRLDADPFLNELFDEEHYTSFGMEYLERNNGLRDLLLRHYPGIAAPFLENDQSAFKPIFGPDKWQEAIENGTVDPSLVELWEKTKADNERFFKSLEKR